MWGRKELLWKCESSGVVTIERFIKLHLNPAKMVLLTLDDVLHPLFVVEDVIPLKKLTDGHILTYHQGLTLNGVPYDVPALYLPKISKELVADIPYFYSIPLLSVSLTKGSVHSITKEMARAGFTRQLVRIPFQEYPSLYDAVPLSEGKIGISSHAYHLTISELLLCEEQAGKRVWEQALRIQKLCLEQLEEFNVPLPTSFLRNYTPRSCPAGMEQP